MYSIKMCEVHDTLRDKYYSSMKQAWEVYGPELAYSSFRYRLLSGKYKYLEYNPTRKVISDNENVAEHPGIRVQDLNSGRIWISISDCAYSLGVSRRAVQLALKRGNPCKGCILERI